VAVAQAAAWLTEKLNPAAVMVPVLSEPEFGATSKVTVFVPDPDAPAVIVIQSLSATAVHVQPAAV
jgi:hypothetical protein